MNKGFLGFSDEEPGLTLLKDEPDDLTHLAPVAGDVVSLETHPFLTDMLDDFLLKDGFCPLLAEEQQDPFIAYNDSCNPSPQLLSPNILKNSECSLPSLNSPSDSLSEEDQMTSFMAFPIEEDPELVMKAPYISMAIGDDLPLLNSEDLMWSNGIEPNRKTFNSNNTTPENTSSLAELLSSSVNKHNMKNDNMNSMSARLLERIDSYSNKNTTWNNENTKMNQLNHHIQPICNSIKRNCTPYDISSKRIKSEPKDMLSSELLQQLISNTGHNTNNKRGKNKGNWLLDTGGHRKAACVSQPSESVLMNLLVSGFDIRSGYICLAPSRKN